MPGVKSEKSGYLGEFEFLLKVILSSDEFCYVLKKCDLLPDVIFIINGF